MVRSGALREAAWRALQGTVAATIAWALAKQLGGDHDPFFAPIAAFIALNAPLGERGLNAVRLIAGVLLGIAVGEATVAAFGGYGGLAVGTFVAATLGILLGGRPQRPIRVLRSACPRRTPPVRGHEGCSVGSRSACAARVSRATGPPDPRAAHSEC